LLLNPSVNVILRKTPTPTDFEGGNLLGTGQAIDRSFGDLEVNSDFPDGHDGVVSWTGRHSLGEWVVENDSIVQNFQYVVERLKYCDDFRAHRMSQAVLTTEESSAVADSFRTIYSTA